MLIHIVSNILRCLPIQILNQLIIMRRIDHVISSQNIAMSTDECTCTRLCQRVATPTSWECSTLLCRKMDCQLAANFREDAYNSRPSHIDCMYYRISNIAARITTCVCCRRESDETDDGENSDYQG